MIENATNIAYLKMKIKSDVHFASFNHRERGFPLSSGFDEDRLDRSRDEMILWRRKKVPIKLSFLSL